MYSINGDVMDVYLDYSICLNYIIFFFVYLFINRVNYQKNKIKKSLIFSLLLSFVIVVYFLFNNIFVLIYFFLVNLLYFKSIFKSILYLFSYLIIALILSVFNEEFILINNYLFLKKEVGIFIFIIILFSLWCLFFLTNKIVKYFKTSKYVYKVILNVNDEELYLKAYYDSGNTLVINNLPVIFLKASKGILLGGVSSFDKTYNLKLKKGNLTLINKNKKIDKLVYINTVSEQMNFYGCDILLNNYIL